MRVLLNVAAAATARIEKEGWTDALEGEARNMMPSCRNGLVGCGHDCLSPHYERGIACRTVLAHDGLAGLGWLEP